MHFSRHLFVAIVCAFLLMPCQSDAALYQSKKTISKQEAASIARSRTGGKVLKVSKHGNTYRVKVLTKKGRVVSVSVSAN